ncbi:MAG: hypothetical protein WKG03_17730 [Telluria sp.]
MNNSAPQSYGSITFDESLPWRTSGRILVAGALLIGVLPVVALLGLGASDLLGCKGGGSSGPSHGCQLIGIGMNWFVDLGLVAFLGAFFAVPAGLVVVMCGLIVRRFESHRRPRRSYGVYSGEGRLLSVPRAIVAIASFDRWACNVLLEAFGQLPGQEGEAIETLRQRAIIAYKNAFHGAP